MGIVTFPGTISPPSPLQARLSPAVERFEGDAAEWDTFVRAQPGWTHFHLYGWRALVEQVFGHECVYLACRGGDGTLRGVLPLVRVRSLLFGHYLVSMPFVNYGGPLGDAEATLLLAERGRSLAIDGRATLLELRSRYPLQLPLAVSHRKIVALLDLPERDPSALWRRLDPKVRSQVRRPQKEGVTVRFGAEQLDPFFDVLARHMRDLGTPTQPRAFFQAIRDRFPEDVWIGCAYLHERPIAAGLGMRWGSEIEMTWASSLLAYKRLAPNMLLYWEFMQRAAAEGIATFNFGRCTPGGGTHRFKRQWGARDEPLWWYSYSERAGATTPAPTDAAYAWGPRLWRLLPMPVATLLGPRIVRYIP